MPSFLKGTAALAISAPLGNITISVQKHNTSSISVLSMLFQVHLKGKLKKDIHTNVSVQPSSFCILSNRRSLQKNIHGVSFDSLVFNIRHHLLRHSLIYQQLHKRLFQGKSCLGLIWHMTSTTHFICQFWLSQGTEQISMPAILKSRLEQNHLTLTIIKSDSERSSS